MKKIIFLSFFVFSFIGTCFSQHIFPLNSYENDGEIRFGRFDVAQDTIFWPLGKKGLLIFDAKDADNLHRVKLYRPYEIVSYKKVYNNANAIEVNGDKAYFAHGDQGFEILDLSNVNDPAVIGRYYRHQEVFNFKIYKGHAILALDHMGVEVISLDDYADMDMISRKNFDDLHVNNIAIYKNYVYASCGVYGLKIIPFNKPLEKFEGRIFPKEYKSEAAIHKIQVYDNFGFLANDAEGLTILDLNLPEYPSVLQTIQTEGKAMDILLDHPLLYVATTRGIEIYDVENPNNISQIDVYTDTKRSFQGLAIENNRLYASYKRGWWLWKKFGMMIFEIE